MSASCFKMSYNLFLDFTSLKSDHIWVVVKFNLPFLKDERTINSQFKNGVWFGFISNWEIKEDICEGGNKILSVVTSSCRLNLQKCKLQVGRCNNRVVQHFQML